MTDKKNDVEELMSVQEKRNDELLKKSNVLATAIGFKNTEGRSTDVLCLKVFVEGKVPKEQVPKDDFVESQYEGYDTDVEEMEPCFATNKMAPPEELVVEKEKEMEYELPEGKGEAEVAPLILQNRVRPVMGGYSIGHYRITAGTLGLCVRDRFYGSSNRHFFILSNNHVLANCNYARIGDPILQPGTYDGGHHPKDTIARLSRYVPINYNRGINLVDAAIAQVNFSNCTREIYWLGYVKAMVSRKTMIRNFIEAIRNRRKINVQKTGRTTDYTVGWIEGLNATVNVRYPGNRIARFMDQIIIKPGEFSAPGDSGSLILDVDENALGLLFAGSSTHTIANHIEHVSRLLKIVISEKIL